MSIESQTMKCDYPGCMTRVVISHSTSWRHDYGWGECAYGDCCRKHLSPAKADEKLLDRVRYLVDELDVPDREKLVAILKALGEEPGEGAGGIPEIEGETP